MVLGRAGRQPVEARPAIAENWVNELKQAIRAGDKVGNARLVHKIRRGLQSESLIRQQPRQLQLAIRRTLNSRSREHGEVLIFKSANVHARPLRTSDATLVCRRCAVNQTGVNGGTTGNQRNRHGRSAVVRQRVEFGIGVVHASDAGENITAVGTEIVPEQFVGIFAASNGFISFPPTVLRPPAAMPPAPFKPQAPLAPPERPLPPAPPVDPLNAMVQLVIATQPSGSQRPPKAVPPAPPLPPSRRRCRIHPCRRPRQHCERTCYPTRLLCPARKWLHHWLNRPHPRNWGRIRRMNQCRKHLLRLAHRCCQTCCLRR